jgi:branched-chain amino acid transport system permease protein
VSPDFLANTANYAINGFVEGLLISLPALALTLVMGIARFANTATGDYMTLSAYAAVGMQKMLVTSLTIAALGSIAAGVALSVLCYWLVFRALRGRPFVTSMIASIGVAFLARSVLTFFVGGDQFIIEVPLTRAWNFSGVRILPTDLAIGGIAIAAMSTLFMLLHWTPIGRQMRAVADNPDLARASGIRDGRIMLVLWVLVGILCALGGVLFGLKGTVVPELGWSLLIPVFAAMIVGGIGSPLGAVAGGVLLGVIQELSVPLVGSSYKTVVAFGMLLLVLLIRPRGLFGFNISAR